jgi:RNA polymerase sigma-70 factor, ECF subfamily
METTEAAAGVTESAPSRARVEFSDFDAVVQTHQRAIYRVLLAILRDADAADTLTQECFLRAYQSRARFHGDCSVRTWLLRIATNLARDHVRNRRLQFWRRLFSAEAASERAYETALDPQPSPEQTVSAREQLAAVWTAVAQLSTRQRTVFVLRFVEDMSMEQIAEAISLRPGTVKAHLFRAIGTVKRHLKEP